MPFWWVRGRTDQTSEEAFSSGRVRRVAQGRGTREGVGRDARRRPGFPEALWWREKERVMSAPSVRRRRDECGTTSRAGSVTRRAEA